MFINKEFTFLWISQIFSQIATNIILFYITVIVYLKTFSNSSVSLVVLFFIFPSFLSSIIAGIIVARMGKKWVLFLVNTIRAFLVIPLIWVALDSSFLYIMLFLLAFITQFFSPAESSLIPMLVPPAKLVSANAYFSSTINITLMIGFLITPLLIKYIGTGIIYFVIILYLLSACSLLFIRFREPLIFTNLKQPICNLIRKFFLYFRYITSVSHKETKIKSSIHTISLFQIVLFVLIGLAPGFAHKILRIGVEDVSFLVVFPTALGFFIASVFLQKKSTIQNERKLKETTYFFTMLICFAIFSIAQIQANVLTRVTLFILLVFFGFFNGRLVIYNYAKIQKNTSVNRAKYFGLLNAYTNLASAIPIVLSGYVSDVMGIDKVIFLLGIFFAYLWRKQK